MVVYLLFFIIYSFNVRRITLSGKNSVNIPCLKTNALKKSINYVLAKLWNKLNNKVRKLTTFKRTLILKDHSGKFRVNFTMFFNMDQAFKSFQLLFFSCIFYRIISVNKSSLVCFRWSFR